MNTTLFSTDSAAKAAGYAGFNQNVHLAIEIPDGNSTLTCRTSEGKLVTFAFLSYQTGGPPQCVDIFTDTAPEVEIPNRYKPKETKTFRPQSIVCFAPFGIGEPYRSDPLATDHRQIVALTTLILTPTT